MKVYKATVEVEAVFYDGTEDSANEVIEFCRNKKGVSKAEKYHKKGKTYNDRLLLSIGNYRAIIVVTPNRYIVKYPRNLFYHYGKDTFENKFTEVNN